MCNSGETIDRARRGGFTIYTRNDPIGDDDGAGLPLTPGVAMCSTKVQPRPGDREPPTHSEIGRWIMKGDRKTREERRRGGTRWFARLAVAVLTGRARAV